MYNHLSVERADDGMTKRDLLTFPEDEYKCNDLIIFA